MGRYLSWYLAGVMIVSIALLSVGYKLGSSDAGVALAQGSGGTPSNNNCYAQLYNANGSKNGAPAWFPCGQNASLYTLNQAQKTATITPGATVLPPTRAIQNGSATACNISMQLLGDSAPTTWTNVQPGAILPVQATIIPAAGTTCTPILALY